MPGKGQVYRCCTYHSITVVRYIETGLPICYMISFQIYKSCAPVIDQAEGEIRLDKTPTDDEIEILWDKVRTS